MAQNEIDMKFSRFVLILACALPLFACSTTARYSWNWNKIPADAHRTGVTAPNAENAVEALGVSNGDFYTAPNGKIFIGGSTPLAAKELFDVQDGMKELKAVIGYSNKGMEKHRPESPLSNWATDVLIEKAQELSGQKIDVSIINFGGIRCDVPQGEVLKDDIVSMFPFKNYVTIVTLKGSRLREIYEQMAHTRPEAVGGCRLVIKNRKLVSATVGGEEIDDNRTYRLATIDFLLNGGDDRDYGKNVDDVQITDVLLMDVILPKVKELTEEGKTLDYECDGRVIFER